MFIRFSPASARSPLELLQFCQCLPGLAIAPAKPYVVQGLWRIQCVLEAKQDRTAIIVFTLLGTALAAAMATMAHQLIIRNRHALGMPGQPLLHTVRMFLTPGLSGHLHGGACSMLLVHELGGASRGCTWPRQLSCVGPVSPEV